MTFTNIRNGPLDGLLDLGSPLSEIMSGLQLVDHPVYIIRYRRRRRRRNILCVLFIETMGRQHNVTLLQDENKSFGDGWRMRIFHRRVVTLNIIL